MMIFIDGKEKTCTEPVESSTYTLNVKYELSAERIDALERITNETTPGQWFACGERVCGRGPECECRESDCYVFSIATTDNKTAKFIAAAREALPQMIMEVRKLNAEKVWLAEQCVKFGDKTPRESAEYWLNAAKLEIRKRSK